MSNAVKDFLKNLIYTNDKLDPKKLALSGAGLAALYGVTNRDSGIGKFLTGGTQRPVGYSEGIPEYGITRALTPDAFLNYPDKEVANFVNKTYGQYGGPGAAAHREIAKAMNQYGVSPTQVARATGFTPQEVEADYKAFGYGTPTTEPAVIGQRRPGSGGRRYFTDTTYTPTGKTMAANRISPVTVPSQLFVPPSSPPVVANRSAQGLFGALTPEQAAVLFRNLFGGDGTNTTTAGSKPPSNPTPIDPNAYLGPIVGPVTPEQMGPVEPIPYAQGGAVPASRGYYLGGSTDGMADEIPATIEDTQPAALSDGEFVVPADVVSGLGNGNSDAGAKVLYSMMDRVRQARTGTKEQGRKIAPNKFTPA
jgi:hypothetical protein